VGAAFGALMVAFGNHLPKITSPWTLEEEPFDWQRVHRTVGWLTAMSGVVVAAGWLWLPLAQANRLQTGVVVGCAVLALGVKFGSVIARARRSRTTAWIVLVGSLVSAPAVDARAPANQAATRIEPRCTAIVIARCLRCPTSRASSGTGTVTLR
jgi:hypothetical protein